jgi:hypothetical protein
MQPSLVTRSIKKTSQKAGLFLWNQAETGSKESMQHAGGLLLDAVKPRHPHGLA